MKLKSYLKIQIQGLVLFIFAWGGQLALYLYLELYKSVTKILLNKPPFQSQNTPLASTLPAQHNIFYIEHRQYLTIYYDGSKWETGKRPQTPASTSEKLSCSVYLKLNLFYEAVLGVAACLLIAIKWLCEKEFSVYFNFRNYASYSYHRYLGS